MFRAAACLSLVLAHVAPTFQPRAEGASELSQLGVQFNLDPFTIVADVEGESRWQPGVINSRSGTVGLAQVDPYNFAACREDRGSERCAFIIRQLQGWQFNLRTIALDFSLARAFCKAHGYGERAIYWLQLPTGFDAVHHTTCGHRNGRTMPVPARVLAILKRRHELERIALARPQSASRHRAAIVEARSMTHRKTERERQ